MKSHPCTRLFRTVSLLSLSLLTAATSFAADFPQRQELEARSATIGMGVRAVPLYVKVAGPGREAALGRLIDQFVDGEEISTRGAFQLEEGEDRLSAVGDDGWFLTVAGDGTSASYRNYALVDERPELALPVERRLGQETLEALGRRVVGEHLRSFITLGENEELVPSFTEFMIAGAGSTDPKATMDPELVLANTVVFTRTIGEIAMIGPGSKIAVTFANDGKVVGFDFDWAGFRPAGESQPVLELGGILERSEALTRLEGAKIERIECGYYDGGARRRDAKALLQAGCYLQTSHRTIIDPELHRQDPASGHLLGAQVEAVPAGVRPLPDQAWPATLALNGLPLPGDGEEGEKGPADKV